MYVRWYADNIWLFVSIQQKVGAFLATIPPFPLQEGANLNAGNINYTTLKAAAVLKKLQDLEAQGASLGLNAQLKKERTEYLWGISHTHS